MSSACIVDKGAAEQEAVGVAALPTVAFQSTEALPTVLVPTVHSVQYTSDVPMQPSAMQDLWSSNTTAYVGEDPVAFDNHQEQYVVGMTVPTIAELPHSGSEVEMAYATAETQQFIASSETGDVLERDLDRSVQERDLIVHEARDSHEQDHARDEGLVHTVCDAESQPAEFHQSSLEHAQPGSGQGLEMVGVVDQSPSETDGVTIHADASSADAEAAHIPFTEDLQLGDALEENSVAEDVYKQIEPPQTHKVMVDMFGVPLYEDVRPTTLLHPDLMNSLPTSYAVSSRCLPQQIGPVGSFYAGPKFISDMPVTTPENVFNISPEQFAKLCHGGVLTPEEIGALTGEVTQTGVPSSEDSAAFSAHAEPSVVVSSEIPMSKISSRASRQNEALSSIASSPKAPPPSADSVEVPVPQAPSVVAVLHNDERELLQEPQAEAVVAVEEAFQTAAEVRDDAVVEEANVEQAAVTSNDVPNDVMTKKSSSSKKKAKKAAKSRRFGCC